MNLPSPKHRFDEEGSYSRLSLVHEKHVLTMSHGKDGQGPDAAVNVPETSNGAKVRLKQSWPWIWPMLGCLSSVAAFLLGRYLPASPPKRLLLYRRQTNVDATPTPSCGGAGVGDSEYDLPLHVGALFIILFVSGSACAFPILSLQVPKLKIPKGAIFLIRHFGTGVLIATAFVHLLPTAFISLGNPCLGKFWTEDYPAMPGAIALLSIIILIIIEMIFSPARLLAKDAATASQDRTSRPRQVSIRAYSGRAASLGRQNTEEPDTPIPSVKGLELTPEQERKKLLTQCVLLECSILFHSIFIGLALSVALGSDFIVLLIAIVFHQTFEGLALGARIAAVGWPPKGSVQPWLMALAYGCTTPLGQAIGLATHTLYDPDSKVGLLVVGIFNAISAGLLAYASLVELLAEDFLSDHSWQEMRGKRRVIGFGLVIFGAAAMALVGAWA